MVNEAAIAMKKNVSLVRHVPIGRTLNTDSTWFLISIITWQQFRIGHHSAFAGHRRKLLKQNKFSSIASFEQIRFNNQ